MRRAVDEGLRALRHRDLSAGELHARLLARGFGEEASREAVATLRRTGLVDDARLAELRASSLGARGAGDALIRHRLEEADCEPEVVARALELLAPERERARAVVARRGPGPRTARYLAGKGFSDEAIREAVAGRDADEIP